LQTFSIFVSVRKIKRENKMLVQKESKIGDIVAENFRAAQVFEKYGLDFCCGGKKTIDQVCQTKGINPNEVVSLLAELPENGSTAPAHFNSWELDFLIDYIVNNHHRYVKQALPVISEHSQKVASKHGENHNEIITISEHFSRIREELEVHMQKEERMLFPYIKQLLEIDRSGEEAPYAPFGTVENPIKVMEAEHEAAGKMMAEINGLSSSFTPPVDACTTYRVLYQELKEFGDDLHMHIHLENNILFPKAIELEKRLSFQKTL
jgi:regulator of cell morphogenesis and NO signaling